MTTVCSYGSERFEGRLRLSFNGNASEEATLNQTYFFGGTCGTITVVPDSSNSKWTISVILHDCDRVQLQCGHHTSSRSDELSNPVTLAILEST